MSAGDRRRVAGQHGEPEVGAERLRDRAHDDPAGAARGRRALNAGVPGDRAGVIVLDHEDVGMLPEDAPELGGARGVEARRRSGSARAASGCRRRRAARSARASAAGSTPASSMRDRLGHEAERRDEVDHAGIAGILDRDAVAGAEVRLQRALDAVERAAGDGERVGGDAVAARAARARARGARPGWRARRRSVASGRCARAPGRGRGAGRGSGCRPRGRGRAAGPARRCGSAAAGAARTCVPRRPCDCSRPRLVRARYAAATVLGLTAQRRGAARARRAPIAPPASRPSRMPASMLLAIALARVSGDSVLYWHVEQYCTSTKGATQVPITGPTPRTTVKRRAQRGVYDHATILRILDEGLVCHMGFVVDGQPFVLPTAYARIDDHLYLHGSPSNRMLRTGKGGVGLCVTVTLLDGLVLARSAFHHSMNYRSVVLLGTATVVDDPAEKRAAFRALVEHVVPGRYAGVRRAERRRDHGDARAAPADHGRLGQDPERTADRRRERLRVAGLGRRHPARRSVRARRSPDPRLDPEHARAGLRHRLRQGVTDDAATLRLPAVRERLQGPPAARAARRSRSSSCTLDIVKGETRTPEFLAKNPNGRIPLLEVEPGKFLAESNAILFYLSEGTPFLPDDRWERAQVLQWMCFEQYSHEPNIATVRFWLHYTELTPERRAAIEQKRPLGYAALDVMERHLASRPLLRRRALHDRRHRALRLHPRRRRGRLRPRTLSGRAGLARRACAPSRATCRSRRADARDRTS